MNPARMDASVSPRRDDGLILRMRGGQPQPDVEASAWSCLRHPSETTVGVQRQRANDPTS